MLRIGKLLATFLLALVMTNSFVPPATANTTLTGSLVAASQAVTAAGTRLLSSTSAGVTFVVNVPWEQLSLETVTMGGKEFMRVSLPGWSEMTQAGAPGLPLLVEEIGAPFGASVTVQVLPGQAHTLTLPAPVLPAATEKVVIPLPTENDSSPELPVPTFVYEEDAGVYASQAAPPRVLAKVSSDGTLRQQRVVGISAYPVQYDPKSMELTVYESLRVEVTFEGTLPTLRQTAGSESDAFDGLLAQELLNYETSRQWRQATTASPTIQIEAGIKGASLPWAPPNPGWRVKVRADGFYKLSYTELGLAGLPVDTLDPRTFQIYNLGIEAAIHVEGEADGSFGVDDYILFYGQSITSKYTLDNVYWLTYGQVTLGKRMATRDGTPGTADTPTLYMAQRHMESNAYYLSYTPGGDDLERWMWDYIYPKSRPNWTYSFTLTAPHSGAATLTVSMLGYLENAVNPDHHAIVKLNNTQVGDVWWDGVTWQTLVMPIPDGLLVAGSNTLQVVCPNDTGLGYDIVYIDWAELAYPNTFLAEGNVLAFHYDVNGDWKFQVDGFNSNQVTVYDVTDPAAPIQITGLSVLGSSPYSAVFQDTLAAAANYWAATSSAYRTVQAIDPQDTASDLSSTDNGADHIVISHANFLAQAQTLSNYRGTQMRAMSVDVQDVYDEFGYGIVGAAPIHDFLAYAYNNWQAPAPAYVVLLGDGNYDPKNYKGSGRVSYIPPYLLPVDPWIRETAADNRYVTLVGDDTLPDMMLGRLAVNSATEAGVFVNKIINYEQSPVAGDWKRQLLMVADNADSAGDFAQLSDNLVTCCLTFPYQAQKVYYGVTHATKADAKAAVLAGINAGKLIVNFIGHGYYTGWADENLFTASDVATLTNGGMLPVVLAMTCREGYYIFPNLYSANQEALAEVVTRADGRGAVASWSATGLGVASGHDYLDRGFFTALFRNGAATLGKATAAGKLNLWATGNNLDLLDTYLLFGDPATVIPVFHAVFLPLILNAP